MGPLDRLISSNSKSIPKVHLKTRTQPPQAVGSGNAESVDRAKQSSCEAWWLWVFTYSVADVRHFKASQTWWLGFHLDSYRVFFGVRQGQSPTQYLVLPWLLKWLFWVHFVLFYVLASNTIGWTWVERIPCTLHVPFNKKIYFCKSYLS